MKTIGFIKSTKENENRRALLPQDIVGIKNKEYLFFEEGYGHSLGIEDEEYLKLGCNVSPKSEVFLKDIICDPKIGDSEYLSDLRKGQIIFGWIHAVQNREITDNLLINKTTAIAWEDMFEKGRHVFWRNNELAGEAAIMHAFTLYGKLPYECNVAILGKGNTARGAYKTLSSLGANVTVYDRRTEKLLREELENYDVVVNGVLWDTSRNDHVIYREDLRKMKKPALIIDISCDNAGAIETSTPTSIENPTYSIDKVMHYVVDHTPSLISHTVSKSISKEVAKYVDSLVQNDCSNNPVLKDAIIVENGEIVDSRIIDFQRR